MHETEIDILREDEIRAVLGTLQGSPLHTIAVLALATGGRRGELLAIRYRDVDFDTGTIRIERAIEQTGSGLAFKPPKTRHGRRTITIPASTVAALRAHRRAQQEQRLALGLGREGPDDLLFTSADGEPMKPNVVTNDWIRATSAIGRPIHLHSLRHVHASKLIAAGVDILSVSRRLGHANAAITLRIYGHLCGNTEDKATAAIEEMFARMAKQAG